MQFNIGVGGEYKLQVFHKGNLKQETPYRKNMVLDTYFKRLSAKDSTDSGLPAKGSNAGCIVGTGSTAVTAGDLALASPLGAVEYKSSFNYLTKTYESGYMTAGAEFVFTFPESSRIGNISELGFYLWRNALSGNLDTRVLIVDGEGNPTTITLVEGDQLVVTYRFYTKIPEVISGTFTVDGIETVASVELCNQNSSYTEQIATMEPFMARNLFGSVNGMINLYATANRNPVDLVGALFQYTGTISSNNSLITRTALNPINIFTGVVKYSFATTHPMPVGGIGGSWLPVDFSSANPSRAGFVLRFVPAIQKGTKKFEVTFHIVSSRL